MAAFSQTLNRRVSLLRPVVGKDSLGQPVTAYEKFGEAWASIKHSGGLESIKAGIVTSTVKASIRFRYRTDLTSAMRVAHGGVTYKVLAVLPDEGGRKHVDLVCEELL